MARFRHRKSKEKYKVMSRTALLLQAEKSSLDHFKDKGSLRKIVLILKVPISSKSAFDTVPKFLILPLNLQQEQHNHLIFMHT